MITRLYSRIYACQGNESDKYSRSLTQPIIAHAWKSAGIVSQKPDKFKILNAICLYASLSQINAYRIDAAIEELQEHLGSNCVRVCPIMVY